MKKRKYIWLLTCLFFLVLAAFFLLKRQSFKETFAYEESDKAVINPFQGAYFQWSTGDAKGMYDVLKAHPDYRVVLLTYNLNDEMEMEEIPADKLGDLESALDIAEELGLSVIFRAAYDFVGEYKDPEFGIMLKHVQQMGKILNTHTSCIMGVQAGMIGAFGEWTQSKYMDSKTYRMQIIEEWEKVLNPRIDIAVRRQKFIREAKEWGCDTDRLGIYNDGLFSSESDLGTYREDYDREQELEWSKMHIKVPFNGGEMPFVSEFSTVENVIKEANMLNLSYLNQEYNYEVWEQWASQEYEGYKGDAYVKMYLGCRPWIKTWTVNRNFQNKKTIHVNANIKNSGFAMIDPDYHVYLVLKCGSTLMTKESLIVMDTKEDGSISGEIENPFSKEEIAEYGLSVGLQISKEKEGKIRDTYCLELANKEVRYEGAVNYLLHYPKEHNKKNQ